MPDTLMKRFGSWLGVWRGPSVLRDGRDAVQQMEFRPFFNGEVLQVDAVIYIVKTQEVVTYGASFWTLGPDGRVINRLFGNVLGFTTLIEQPDDEDALSMQGALQDNTTFAVNFRRTEDELHFTSSLREGYAVKPNPPRATAILKHITDCAP